MDGEGVGRVASHLWIIGVLSTWGSHEAICPFGHYQRTEQRKVCAKPNAVRLEKKTDPRGRE